MSEETPVVAQIELDHSKTAAERLSEMHVQQSGEQEQTRRKERDLVVEEAITIAPIPSKTAESPEKATTSYIQATPVVEEEDDDDDDEEEENRESEDKVDKNKTHSILKATSMVNKSATVAQTSVMATTDKKVVLNLSKSLSKNKSEQRRISLVHISSDEDCDSDISDVQDQVPVESDKFKQKLRHQAYLSSTLVSPLVNFGAPSTRQQTESEATKYIYIYIYILSGFLAKFYTKASFSKISDKMSLM